MLKGKEMYDIKDYQSALEHFNKAIEYDLHDCPLQGGGEIVKIVDNNQIVVSCSDGFLLLQDYEIAPNITKEEENIYIKEGNKFG